MPVSVVLPEFSTVKPYSMWSPLSAAPSTVPSSTKLPATESVIIAFWGNASSEESSPSICEIKRRTTLGGLSQAATAPCIEHHAIMVGGCVFEVSSRYQTGVVRFNLLTVRIPCMQATRSTPCGIEV